MDIKPLQKVLDAEVDRKEFLMYVGASVLAVTGVAGIVRALVGENQTKQPKGIERAGGYGNSPYGK